MKSPADARLRVYQYLKGADFKTRTGLTGDIYNGFRPDVGEGNHLEDAVINALPFDGEQFQGGVVILNLYVKDVTQVIKGVEQTQPDQQRLHVLTTAALALVNEVTGSDYGFWVENIAEIAQPETGEHYCNLRLAFQFLTLD